MVRSPLHFHGRLPVPEVAPLTYRDGVTHLELVYELSQYLKNILHPSLQSTVDQVVADAEQLLSDANAQYVDGVQEFQRIHDAFMSDVNASLIALNDSAVSDLVQDATSLLGIELRKLFVLVEDYPVFYDMPEGGVQTLHDVLRRTGSLTLRGDYVFDRPLVVPSGVSVDATAARITLDPNVDWHGEYGNRGILEFVSVHDVKWSGGVFDAQGQHSRAVLMMDVTDTVLEHVTFRDFGSSQFIPSSGFLTMVSRENYSDDRSDIPGVYENVFGPVEHNTFRDIHIELSPKYQAAFGIRMVTDWSGVRSHSEYLNRVAYNTFENFSVHGEFYWNHVELAGGGTQHNSFDGVHTVGKSLNAFDLDKGTSWNTATNLRLEQGGLPSQHVNTSSVILGILAIHGNAGGLLCVGNEVRGAIIGVADTVNSQNRNNNDCAILFLNARDNTVQDVVIHGLNGGEVGSAVNFNHNATHNTVTNIHAENVNNGVYTSGSSRNTGHNTVLDSVFRAWNNALSLGGASSSVSEGWTIRGGTYETIEGSVCMLVAPPFHGIRIQDVECIGGVQGLTFSSSGFRAESVRSIGATTNSYRSNNPGPVVGEFLNCTSDLRNALIVNNNSVPPHRVGNTFDGRVVYADQPPTSGDWARGDRVINASPWLNSPSEWVCINNTPPFRWASVGSLVEE